MKKTQSLIIYINDCVYILSILFTFELCLNIRYSADLCRNFLEKYVQRRTAQSTMSDGFFYLIAHI